jgi:endonuclease YncB( thermonuclease family)
VEKPVLRIAAAIALWTALTPALGATLEGRVVKIADGDTLTMIVEGQQEKIRLSDIDTPERKQPYGMRAKQALAEMTFGKTISVFTTSRDRYGRVIGHVTAEGVDINAELVRLGYAWVYRRYSNDPELLRLEESARAEKLGLWAESNPIPPWEWRRGRRPSSDSLAASPKSALSGL